MRSGERTTGTEVLEGTGSRVESIRAGVRATVMPCNSWTGRGGAASLSVRCRDLGYGIKTHPLASPT
jgi:hypothetical protein